MSDLGREDEYTEFKESTAELDKGLISMTAMLNKHCKGTVYFGVKDDGRIVGQDVGKTTLKSITQAIANFIDPHILPDVSILETDDGKRYIRVQAEGHDRPYICKGSAYVRSGEEDRKSTHLDLRKMILSSGDLLKDTRSVNQKLTFSQLSDILKRRGLSTRDDDSFLSSLGLFNSEGAFNMQAEILSDQNTHPLTVAVFGGLDRTRLSQRKDYGKGCLLNGVVSVIDYVESINEKYVDVTGRSRVERDLFDFPAFKEAWINACVHNNWIGQIPPAVYIFDDRIEVISYGDRPYWMSEEEFFEGQSMPVNESLMRIFLMAGLCEHTGHGVPVITKAYGRGAFKFLGGCTVVTLTFYKKRIASKYRDEGNARVLSENEALVLTTMKEHPDYSLDRISDITGLGRSTVGKIVPMLNKMGYVERKGSKRNGEWVVHAGL